MMPKTSSDQAVGIFIIYVGVADLGKHLPFLYHYRQKFKTFHNLMEKGLAHEKKDFVCDIIPSCSFAGIEFVIKKVSLKEEER